MHLLPGNTHSFVHSLVLVMILTDTGGNYGIAYKGNVDKPLFPVTVVPSLNIEGANQDAMTDGSNTRPTFLSTTSQTLTLTVTGITAGKSYTIYRFSSWKVDGTTATPQDFTQLSRATAIATFTATGTSYTAVVAAYLGDQVSNSFSLLFFVTLLPSSPILLSSPVSVPHGFSSYLFPLPSHAHPRTRYTKYNSHSLIRSLTHSPYKQQFRPLTCSHYYHLSL